MTLPSAPAPHVRTAETAVRDALPEALARRLALHARLLACVRDALPDDLARQCTDCVRGEGGRIAVYVADAAHASQVRFFATALREALYAAGFAPSGALAIRVTPAVVRRRISHPVPDAGD